MGTRVVATGFGVLRGPGSSGAWVAAVSFLTSFLQLLEEAWTAQRAKRGLRARTGAEVQVLILWRCPVLAWIHLRVLVSDLLGMGWDRVG